ncbi:methyltransferase [Pseudomonas sp. MIACH]|uniref:methyltransferase n=1 Tax=Pseudomonas sp. MIACH TaxID=1078355 RepID=UPI00069D398C|nr:methyltransferase [Pseudomonas sp. MIACH]
MLARDGEARFEALDAFLIEHQGLWRPRPFTHRQLPWEAEHPQLARWLRQRSLSDAETSHNHPHALPAPAPFPALACEALRLSAVDKLPTHPLHPAAHRLNVDVPGRKWQQIEAFGAALHFAQTPRHWLDWCAGKGHLGRRLLHTGQQLTCLEYDPALIASGQALSEHHGLPVTHRLQDVMADVSLSPEHTPVALHACGDLHVRLLQLASAAGCKQLAVAPCCYNRINTHTYQPLSEAGRASTLQLSLDDLGLPLSETVTAGKRVRLQRDISMARRLGFDQLQRQLRHCDEYLPTPSLPASWLDKPFADYCQALASLKGLSTGAQDWAALEAHGWQRLAEVRNLELVRGLFRRPLEVWLVLDRALYLGERGYRVEVGSFCETALTPRNLMVLAERD